MKKVVPQQIEGHQLDYRQEFVADDIADARAFYEVARERLLNINDWDTLSNFPAATFLRHDPHGEPGERPLQQGDYVRIVIPGPGLPSTKGYDWVRVEHIHKEETAVHRRTSLTVRPAPDPNSDRTETAHFFKSFATSTLSVELRGRCITARYAGRNQKINTKNEGLMDKIRNFLVGMSAKLGASTPQWKALINGIVKPVDPK